ncbi:hypothetical protein B0H13DRAFT_2037345 [Mycena leptocephala]|nr:hypothetical protein B0H13DRAFT_2037345 [Mycena leptocephala]
MDVLYRVLGNHVLHPRPTFPYLSPPSLCNASWLGSTSRFLCIHLHPQHPSTHAARRDVRPLSSILILTRATGSRCAPSALDLLPASGDPSFSLPSSLPIRTRRWLGSAGKLDAHPALDLVRCSGDISLRPFSFLALAPARRLGCASRWARA